MDHHRAGTIAALIIRTPAMVAGDTYYYIANAQLRRFRDGKIFPWDSLQPVLVLRTDLR